MTEADDSRDAESVFIPQLLLDLIQKLVECNVLRTEDAAKLISSSLDTSAECNPSYAETIMGLKPFCERFATPRPGEHG